MIIDSFEKCIQIYLPILEPLLESIPQVHILLCLWGIHPKLITGNSHGSRNPQNNLFLATFFTSLISAAKGIASFLQKGPCRLVSDIGLFGGMGTMGFIFLCLNISLTLVGKNFLLFWAYNIAGRSNSDEKVMLYWACFNIVPQFILVSSST